MGCTRGEEIIDSINSVEDTKGNPLTKSGNFKLKTQNQKFHFCALMMKFSMFRLLVLLLSYLIVTYCSSSVFPSVMNVRGGGQIGPRPNTLNEDDYYDQFELNYGSKDRIRQAGSLRGFLKRGSLGSLPEKDPFLSWMNKYLEDGPAVIKGRLKPYYIADFGTKADLGKNEHPRIVIATRKLAADANGFLLSPPPTEVDVEIREVWQPWLRHRCNFAVRYVVPNRKNIIDIMAVQGRFTSRVVAKDASTSSRSDATSMTLLNEMIFRPSRWEWILGQRSVSIWRKLPTSALFGAQHSLKMSDDNNKRNGIGLGFKSVLNKVKKGLFGQAEAEEEKAHTGSG